MLNHITKDRAWYLVPFVVLALAITLVAGSRLVRASSATLDDSPDGALNLSLDVHSTGLSSPVSVTNAGPGDDRIFVVERAGRIKIALPNGAVLGTPFLNIVSQVQSSGSEQGLLGLAFHPDYANNGYFYVNYTHLSGSITRTRISRFTVSAGDPNQADPNSEVVLLTVTQPFANHNAGDIHFGTDGFLYIPLGDGGSGGDPNNNAQTYTTLLGKISRIDVDMGPGDPPDCVSAGSGQYTIPFSNPRRDGPGGECDEIWAAGLRNPWRSSFDRATGDFYIGDVGQSSWEEIDFQPAASAGDENYGWRCYEGDGHPYNTSGCGPAGNYDPPVFEFANDAQTCAVIGGYVYRGSLYPDMVGHYFLSDYCAGDVWDLTPGSWASTRHETNASGIASFGESASGELYLANTNNGILYHLVEDTLATPTSTPTPTDTPTPTATATCAPTPTPQATATPGGPPLDQNHYLPLTIKQSGLDYCY